MNETSEKRVAAILYFEDGWTVEEVKKMLHEVARLHKGTPTFNRMHVQSYDPRWGQPVWCIP